ncbi:uncharacterized protein [Drosophila bipectinata]|uniref:uncharacterized protein n=1 Tax=Drosophila bipectinata TaxID=42026 RepID=UPI001C8AB3F7|nr:uncharacterized protein LOC108133046 [Drosophila bipectinata]
MVVGLIVKAGIVYAVIVATRNYGVWGSPDDTQEVYVDARDQIEPYADQARRKLKMCPPRPPPQGQWAFFGVHYYNQFVKAVFDVLSLVPYGLAAVFEKIPFYLQAIRESIRKYQEQKKKEIKISKDQLDETPLVQRPKGELVPHCKDKNCSRAPLIPPHCQKRYNDEFIYEPRPAKKSSCKCKCKQRQPKPCPKEKRKCPPPKDLPQKEKVCRCPGGPR